MTTAPALTERQQQVLELMAQGLTIPFIATELELSEQTVRVHQRGIYQRLGVHSGPAAVAAGYQMGLLVQQQPQDFSERAALAAELKRTREVLRATESDLGQERQWSASLVRRLAAAEAELAGRQVLTAVQSVAAVDVPCGEILNERTITDVPTGGLL